MTETGNAGGTHQPREVEVVEVIHETRDACSFVLRAPTGDHRLRNYLPGQYLTMRIPSERTGSVARCYSLASWPHHDDDLVVTVKRTAEGYASNWLCDNICAGDIIAVLPPSGRFTPASLDADLLLFAGGSGITPIYSILRSALSEGSGSITMFYANRDEASVIFARDIDALSRSHPDRLEVIHWLESVQGVPDAGIVRELARRRGGREAFICGPSPFMSGVGAALEESGMSHKRIHREVYTSLSGNPFEETEESRSDLESAATEGDAADAVAAEVELDGATHEVMWPRTKSLVDVLLAKKHRRGPTCAATANAGRARPPSSAVRSR